MPSASWRRLWKRAPWLHALCGAMPEPSEADRGVALWMASLAASRASLIASPAGAPGSKTNATYSARSGGSSSSRAPGGALLKTSPECCPGETALRPAQAGSGEAYSAWVSRLREDCSRRGRSAPLTSGNDCSFSAWPTAVVTDSFGARNATSGRKPDSKHHSDTTLTDAIWNWPTPAARDYRSPNSQDSQDSQDRRNEGSTRGQQLPNFVEHLWVTPTAAISEGGQLSRSGDRKDELLLTGQAAFLSSHQALTNSPPGEKPLTSGRRLNPQFVEWMMGWPTGWSACACSGTEWSHWLERMRSALSQLASPPAAPPAQLSLFG